MSFRFAVRCQSVFHEYFLSISFWFQRRTSVNQREKSNCSFFSSIVDDHLRFWWICSRTTGKIVVEKQFHLISIRSAVTLKLVELFIWKFFIRLRYCSASLNIETVRWRFHRIFIFFIVHWSIRLTEQHESIWLATNSNWLEVRFHTRFSSGIKRKFSTRPTALFICQQFRSLDNRRRTNRSIISSSVQKNFFSKRNKVERRICSIFHR